MSHSRSLTSLLSCPAASSPSMAGDDYSSYGAPSSSAMTPRSSVSNTSSVALSFTDQMNKVLLRLTDMEISLKKLLEIDRVNARLAKMELATKEIASEQKKLAEKLRLAESNIRVSQQTRQFTFQDVKERVFDMVTGRYIHSFEKILKEHAPLVETDFW